MPNRIDSTTSAVPPAKDILPIKRPGRLAAAGIVLVGIAMLLNALTTNPNFEWPVVAEYLFYPSLLTGLVMTIEVTVFGMILGTIGGTLLAIMRLNGNWLSRSVAGAFIWFFRGTPLLVQLIFWYNIAALYPRLSLGIPFGPEFISEDTNTLIIPFTAALLAFSTNEAAYMAEIVRSGILAVPSGQFEAGLAIGLKYPQLLRRVVLPQALRIITPPTVNEIITMIKNTSLMSVIALPELLYASQLIYERTFQTIPLLIVASLWYLVLVSILTVLQSFIERRLGRGRS